MTFDEWYRTQPSRFIAANLKEDMRDVWDVATKAEREACATKAHYRGVLASQLGQAQAEACAKDIYDEIVGRSNVELTGSGQVHRPESSDRRE